MAFGHRYMDKVLVTQSRHSDVEWTEFKTRACLAYGKRDEYAIEMHIEHFEHKFFNKRGRTHSNFPVLTIEQAKQLRDNLDTAIKEAMERENQGRN